MNTQAQNLITKFIDVVDLMIALDTLENVEIDQLWESETTVWTFPDASAILISGAQVDIK